MALDSNNNTSLCLHILADIPGKGKGLLAGRDIVPGTMIMREKAVLEIRHDIMLKERVARNTWGGRCMIWCWLELILVGVIVFLTYHSWPMIGCLMLFSCHRAANHIAATQSCISFHLCWHDLVKQTESLHLVVKNEFESLLNVFPSSDAYQNYLGIFCTNSFQLGESDRSALFLKMSRLNHSCRANCDYIIRHGCIEVRATRPVSAGEELTICYNNFLEEDAPVVKSERKEYLLWAYRFSCKCEDCSLT